LDVAGVEERSRPGMLTAPALFRGPTWVKDTVLMPAVNPSKRVYLPSHCSARSDASA
jgi:hypothetical protein